MIQFLFLFVCFLDSTKSFCYNNPHTQKEADDTNLEPKRMSKNERPNPAQLWICNSNKRTEPVAM